MSVLELRSEFRPELAAGQRLRRPTRVALFSGNYNYTADGANKALNRLVGHLQDEAGAEVRVYSPTTAHPAFPPVGDLVSVPSVAIPMRPDYRLALGLSPAVRRDVLGFRPDIVHVSAPDLLGSAAIRLARSIGAPVVASLHTLFDSYLGYYALGGLQPLVRRRLAAFYDRCDYILAPTEALAEELRESAQSAKVRIWARGVDEQLFNPARRSEVWRAQQGFVPDRPVIVFLGRLVMEKGLAVFAQSIRRLEQTGPAPQVLVIGDGPARDWFAERLPNAVFTGYLSGPALATALASGDIFFNPSCTETFGNVNLEAMASGLAVVCADAPNTRCLLQHGVDALLCRAGDTTAFGDALRRLSDAPRQRRRIAQLGHQRSQAFRWRDVLSSVVEVYDEALAGRSSLGMDTAAQDIEPLPGRAHEPFEVALTRMVRRAR